jgi:diguanylate cyclase (GGDEF)-like protein
VPFIRYTTLANILNRRAFSEFLHEEWRRRQRLKNPISLAIVDLDYFKLLNDTHGHQAGDACLVKVGSVIKKYTNRPGDIFAREELHI